MKNILALSMLICFGIICSCQKQDSAAEQQLAQRKAEPDAREESLAERLNSLEEKVNWLDQSVKELAEKENAIASARTSSPNQLQRQVRDSAQSQASQGQVPNSAQWQASQGQVPDSAQWQALQGRLPDSARLQAERDPRVREQLLQLQGLIPDASAEANKMRQEQVARTQRTQEELQRTRAQMQNQGAMSAGEQTKIDAAKQAAMNGRAVSPSAEATTPPQLVPLSVYPQAETTSPTPSPTPQ